MICCPHDQSEDVQKRGLSESGKSQRYQCNKCRRYFSIKVEELGEVSKPNSYFKEENGKGEIGLKTTERITTLEQLIRVCEIDTMYWEIERWICNKWEVGAAPRATGHSKNWKRESADVVITPLFQVKVWLRKRAVELRASSHAQDLIKEAKEFAPKYPKIKYQKHENGLLYEVQIPDIHFGRLTWAEESGENYDIKIAKQVVDDVIDRLLNYTQHFEIDKILLPLGNDFFNVNNTQNTTSHGTPQQEDVRFQKTFRFGRELVVNIIDKCSTIAPVDVLVIPGNHDEERMFYLGDALESWYHANPNVNIYNQAKKRKYYRFGKVLLGFTHGAYEKQSKLPLLMAMEAAQDWAKSEFREWHLGHQHNKKDVVYFADESVGVVVRVLRAIASPDAWTHDHAYVGAERAAESFLWHPDNGLLAQFTAVVK